MAVTNLSNSPSGDQRADATAYNLVIIRTAVDISPDKIAIVGVTGAYDSTGISATTIDPEGYDHLAVAYFDIASGAYKLLEMVPSDTLTQAGKQLLAELEKHDVDDSTAMKIARLLGSENKPRETIDQLASDYSDASAVALVLPEGKAGAYLDLLREGTKPGKTYSFLSVTGSTEYGGETCASVIVRNLMNIDPTFATSPGNFPSMTEVIRYFATTLGVDLTKYPDLEMALDLNFIEGNAVFPGVVLEYFAKLLEKALDEELTNGGD